MKPGQILPYTMVILALLGAALDILGTLDIPKVAVFDYDLDASGTGFFQVEAHERRERGLHVLLWGTVAAMVPILVAGLIAVIAPDFDANVLQIAFVPSLALPLVLGYAVWKSDRWLQLHQQHHGSAFNARRNCSASSG